GSSRPTSSSGLNGLQSSASAPASAASRSVVSPPVSTITSGGPKAGLRFRSLQSASPSVPGKPTSRITTSGRQKRASWSASSAEEASSSSNSSAASVARSSTRN